MMEEDKKSGTTLKTTPDSANQEEGHCPEVLRLRGYDFMEMIGSGGFSNVYKAEGPDPKHPERKIRMACKVITFSKVPENWKKSALSNELKISRYLHHPNVICVYNITKTMRNAYIFMEMATSDMSKYIARLGHGLSEPRTQFWFREAMQALEYMCVRGVAHRDLKTDNLLLVAQHEGGSPHVKIADFSFACYVKDKITKKIHLMTTECGTREYMAPEIYSGTSYDPRFADMWAAGIILFEMLTMRNPFPFADQRMTNSDFVELAKDKAWKFPTKDESRLSSEAKDLTYKLLEANPRKRYDGSQCLAHPFLKTNAPGPGSNSYSSKKR